MAPAFGGAERLQQFLLADQIILLVVAGNAGVADRRDVLTAEAQDLGAVKIPAAGGTSPVRHQFAGLLPTPKRLDFNAEH